MTITISPADTGDIRRVVGEETQILSLDDGPVIPRRPVVAGIITGEYEIVVPATIGIVDGPAEVPPPFVEEPSAYVGRHRAAESVERRVPWWRTPEWNAAMSSLLRRKAGVR